MAGSVVKRGYLDMCIVKRDARASFRNWYRRYFVLHKKTPGIQASLLWFKGQDAESVNSGEEGFFVEEIVGASFIGKSGVQFSIELKGHLDWGKLLLKGKQAAYCGEWVRCIQDVLTTHAVQDNLKPPGIPSGGALSPTIEGRPVLAKMTFDVTVIPTEKSQCCGLAVDTQYLLRLYGQHIALVDRGADKTLFAWPYMCLRHFGARHDKVFSMETGRLALTGEGFFLFATPQAKQLLTAMQDVIAKAGDFTE